MSTMTSERVVKYDKESGVISVKENKYNGNIEWKTTVDHVAKQTLYYVEDLNKLSALSFMMSDLFETHSVSDNNEYFSEYSLKGVSALFDVITHYIENKELKFSSYLDILSVIGESEKTE